MKLTFITGYFDPEQTADVHLNHDLAYGLSDLGIEVTVVTPFPNRGLSKDEQDKYLDKSEEVISKSLKIIRVGKPSTYRKTIAVRGAYLLRRTAQLYKTAKNIQTDIYLVTSTPPFLGYIAAVLSKKAPVLYKLQDVFPDSLAFTNSGLKKTILFRILQKLEKWVYRHCDAIAADSDDIKKTITDSRVEGGKVTVIYDWIDEKSCVPVDKPSNPLFEKYSIPKDCFCVCYAGNIGPLQNTRLIVDAAKEIERQRVRDIVFVIAGNGSYEKELDKYIETLSCKNIIRIPMQPVDSVSYVYSLGDVDLVTLIPGMTRIALPSKIWSIMSSGRASICSFDKDSELCRILKTNGCGMCVKADDYEGLANAILDLYRDKKKTLEMGVASRIYIEKNMTSKMAILKYYDLIGKLLTNT